MSPEAAQREAVQIDMMSPFQAVALNIRCADFKPSAGGSTLAFENERGMCSERLRHGLRLAGSIVRGKIGERSVVKMILLLGPCFVVFP